MTTNHGDSLMPDLNGTSCVAGDCTNVADKMLTAVVEVPVYLGFPDPIVNLELAVCIDHAHQLRGGGQLLAIE